MNQKDKTILFKIIDYCLEIKDMLENLLKCYRRSF